MRYRYPQPPKMSEEEIAACRRERRREQRFEIAKTALQGLASGVQWQSGMLVNAEEMASDAVGLADALLDALEK